MKTSLISLLFVVCFVQIIQSENVESDKKKESRLFLDIFKPLTKAQLDAIEESFKLPEVSSTTTTTTTSTTTKSSNKDNDDDNVKSSDRNILVNFYAQKINAIADAFKPRASTTTSTTKTTTSTTTPTTTTKKSTDNDNKPSDRNILVKFYAQKINAISGLFNPATTTTTTTTTTPAPAPAPGK